MSETEKKTKRTRKQRTDSEQAAHDKRKKEKAERRAKKAAKEQADQPEVKTEVKETPVSKGPTRDELLQGYLKEHVEDPLTLASLSASTRVELLTRLLSTAKTDLKVANNAVVKAARKANKKANKGKSPPKQSKWNDFVKVYRSKNEGMSYKDALKEGKTLYNELKQDADKLNQYLSS